MAPQLADDKGFLQHLAGCKDCFVDMTFSRTPTNITTSAADLAFLIKSERAVDWVTNWIFRPFVAFVAIGLLVAVICATYSGIHQAGVEEGMKCNEEQTRKSKHKPENNAARDHEDVTSRRRALLTEWARLGRSVMRDREDASGPRRAGAKARAGTGTPDSDADLDDFNDESSILHDYDEERYLECMREGSECSTDDTVDDEGDEKDAEWEQAQ